MTSKTVPSTMFVLGQTAIVWHDGYVDRRQQSVTVLRKRMDGAWKYHEAQKMLSVAVMHPCLALHVSRHVCAWHIGTVLTKEYDRASLGAIRHGALRKG